MYLYVHLASEFSADIATTYRSHHIIPFNHYLNEPDKTDTSPSDSPISISKAQETFKLHKYLKFSIIDFSILYPSLDNISSLTPKLTSSKLTSFNHSTLP